MNVGIMSYDLGRFKDRVVLHTPKMVVFENLIGEFSVHTIYLIQDNGIVSIKIHDLILDKYIDYDEFLEKHMVRGYTFVK